MGEKAISYCPVGEGTRAICVQQCSARAHGLSVHGWNKAPEGPRGRQEDSWVGCHPKTHVITCAKQTEPEAMDQHTKLWAVPEVPHNSTVTRAGDRTARITRAGSVLGGFYSLLCSVCCTLTLLQLHMDCHFPHGRLACKTLWVLLGILPLSFPPVALQGCLGATTAQPCHLGSHPRLCRSPLLACGPS